MNIYNADCPGLLLISIIQSGSIRIEGNHVDVDGCVYAPHHCGHPLVVNVMIAVCGDCVDNWPDHVSTIGNIICVSSHMKHELQLYTSKIIDKLLIIYFCN